VGAALVTWLVLLAWRERRTPLGFALGAFLLCLVPANTILPKNEIVKEWRLYPSLFFFALVLAELAARAHGLLARRLDQRLVRAAGCALLAVWLAVFAHSIDWQNRIYRTRAGAWEQVLARYPDWADAMNNLGTERVAEGKLYAAQTLFERAHAAAPETYIYLENLASLQQTLGDPALAERTRAEALRVREKYGPRVVSYRYR
jgi:tetratricopeptide (TPR) repeat protein